MIRALQSISSLFSCRSGCCPGIVRSMSEPDVYPNAPVVLVAVEVRHPTADALTPAENRAMKSRLSEHLPIERSGQQVSVQLLAGAPVSTATTEHFPRYVNRDMTLSVSIRREAVVIEASRYPGWEEFRALVYQALDARTEVAPIAGVERLGLRYIDEVRIPGDDEVDWAEWIHPSLLGPTLPSAVDLPISQWQGLGIYGVQPGNTLVFRYGPREGFAIDPSSDLRRVKQADAGLFFLMDIDSFWTPNGPIPEYDREMMVSTCDTLHTPARTLFEGMITDRLRDEVLRANG